MTKDNDLVQAAMSDYEKKEREHNALLATLEVPTYEDRSLQAQWVSKREQGTNSFAITGTTGWTAGCSKEVADLLPEGKAYILETRGFSQITGWIIDGVWYDRKSDQDLARAHEEFVASVARRNQESLEAHRKEWSEREAALPDWIRRRVETFHTKGGLEFELSGWGYELIIAELAVEYAALGEVILDKDVFQVGPHESEAIKKISREEGTSGNQHGAALSLAKAHLNDPERSMVNTVSALAPLTGDAFYEKKS